MNTCNQIELDTSDITELEHTNCIRDYRIKFIDITQTLPLPPSTHTQKLDNLVTEATDTNSIQSS